MPRIPTIINLAPSGTTNLNRPTGRSLPTPSARLPGPAPLVQHFRNRQQNQVQQASAAAASQATANPIGNSNLIRGVTFTAGNITTVQHGLGQAYAGAWPTNVTGGYGIFQVVPNTDARLNKSQVRIQSLHDCTADVLAWV